MCGFLRLSSGLQLVACICCDSRMGGKGGGRRTQVLHSAKTDSTDVYLLWSPKLPTHALPRLSPFASKQTCSFLVHDQYHHMNPSIIPSSPVTHLRDMMRVSQCALQRPPGFPTPHPHRTAPHLAWQIGKKCPHTTFLILSHPKGQGGNRQT